EKLEGTQPGCTVTTSNVRPGQGSAQIKDIDFEQKEDAPPVPTKLKIDVFFGGVSWDFITNCGRGTNEPVRAVSDSIEVAQAISGKADVGPGLTIDKGWPFDSDPFSAEFKKAAKYYEVKASVEVTLTHTPAP